MRPCPTESGSIKVFIQRHARYASFILNIKTPMASPMGSPMAYKAIFGALHHANRMQYRVNGNAKQGIDHETECFFERLRNRKRPRRTFGFHHLGVHRQLPSFGAVLWRVCAVCGI